jgi:ribosomal protein L37E
MSHSARVVKRTPHYLILNSSTGERAIYCRHCTWVSYNKGDIENRYCAHCHKFHAERDREAELMALIEKVR